MPFGEALKRSRCPTRSTAPDLLVGGLMITYFTLIASGRRRRSLFSAFTNDLADHDPDAFQILGYDLMRMFRGRRSFTGVLVPELSSIGRRTNRSFNEHSGRRTLPKVRRECLLAAFFKILCAVDPCVLPGIAAAYLGRSGSQPLPRGRRQKPR